MEAEGAGTLQGKANKQGVLGNMLCLKGPRSRGEAGRVCGGLGGREEAPRPSGFGILRNASFRWEERLESTP